MHSVSLSLIALCVTVVAVPAMAQQQIIYDNGPVNGQVNARMINYGSAITDSFQNNNGLLFLSSISFYVWLFPGDILTQFDVSIGSAPFGSDLYHATIQGPGQGNCFQNRYGYNVCLVSASFSLDVFGTAWLTLQNASVPSGNPVYWDQNSGVGCMSQGCPSLAIQKTPFGTPSATILSETFTIYGEMIATKTSTETNH
jgi:hypothetical protein